MTTPTPLTLPGEPASCLIYGDTEAGKTQQIGFFSKWLFKKTGGKLVQGRPEGGLRTRLYCADEAGWRTIQPYVNLGLVEPVRVLDFKHPWVWLDAITKGKIPDPKTGKWIAAGNEQIGCFAFDSLTGISDALMQDMTERAAKGENIGGEGAYRITDGVGLEQVVIGASNKSHYGVAQSQIVHAVGKMNRLLVKPAYVIATATARRGQEDTQAQVMGPQVAGKALTSELPRLFTYTFHLVTRPKDNDEPEHQLWFVSHIDKTAANAKGLANRRIPLADPTKKHQIPPFISPADVSKAFEAILGAERDAERQLIEELQ